MMLSTILGNSGSSLVSYRSQNLSQKLSRMFVLVVGWGFVVACGCEFIECREEASEGEDVAVLVGGFI